MDDDATYILGSSRAEQERLAAQARAIAGTSRRLLERVGIRPGMRVLDVGCGTGELSRLVAEMVGESGTVIAVDRDAAVLETAREEARRAGLQNLQFHESDFRDLPRNLADFELIAGRLVLMYQKDPAAAVRSLVDRSSPGGVIVFQEYDSTIPPTSVPELTLRNRVASWIWQTMRASGVEPQMGTKLYPVLRAGGLERVQAMAEVIVQTPETHYPVAPLVRRLLPSMEEYGVATAAEVGIDTLEQRLFEEISASGGVSIGPIIYGAWGHRPWSTMPRRPTPSAPLKRLW